MAKNTFLAEVTFHTLGPSSDLNACVIQLRVFHLMNIQNQYSELLFPTLPTPFGCY